MRLNQFLLIFTPLAGVGILAGALHLPRIFSDSQIEREAILVRPDRLPGLHLGLKGSLAGLLWLRHLNYFGARVLKRSLTQESYLWMCENLEGIIRLEPQFSDPPLFASDVLAFFGERVTEAHRLLLLALTGQSLEWQIYFRLGVIYMKWYGDFVGAAEWWRFATLSPSSPLWLPNLVHLTLLRFSGEVEEGMLEVIAERPLTPELREEWERIRTFLRALKEWNSDLRLFRTKRGRDPEELSELIEAGIWKEIPLDPWGGAVRLSPDKKKIIGSDRIPVFFKERPFLPIPAELRSGDILKELRLSFPRLG